MTAPVSLASDSWYRSVKTNQIGDERIHLSRAPPRPRSAFPHPWHRSRNLIDRTALPFAASCMARMTAC